MLTYALVWASNSTNSAKATDASISEANLVFFNHHPLAGQTVWSFSCMLLILGFQNKFSFKLHPRPKRFASRYCFSRRIHYLVRKCAGEFWIVCMFHLRYFHHLSARAMRRAWSQNHIIFLQCVIGHSYHPTECIPLFVKELFVDPICNPLQWKVGPGRSWVSSSDCASMARWSPKIVQ